MQKIRANEWQKKQKLGDEDDAISGRLREHEKELEIDQCSVGNRSLEIFF
jgi:hypothetical protein